jgi:uncharacterized protein YndB with AHSA1/START domain
MATHNESATAEQQETISIKRIFNLPLNTVWKAWTEPESLKKWWGPKEYTCPYCAIDLKPGGKYLNSMKGPDGTEIWGTGTYKKIVSNKKIVYTDSFADSKGNVVPASYYKMTDMPLEMMVTVTLEEVNGKTNMQLKHEGIPAEIYDDCIKGWQSSFDKLETNL